MAGLFDALQCRVFAKGVTMRRTVVLPISCAFIVMVLATAAMVHAQDSAYVGDEACKDCHEAIYDSFHLMSPKKAEHSDGFPHLLEDFTPEQQQFCFDCHVTGAGQEGGFVSFEETDHLGHVGCETCHGPGQVHADFGDPADILPEPGMEGCVACHNGERVPLPKVYGRPHGLNE